MMKQRFVYTALCAAVMSVFGTVAFAQTQSASASTNVETTRLANRYSAFAGSDANADALVNGLRSGSAVTLETTSTVKNPDGTTSTVATPTTFQPATGKLGYGEVNIALALAQDELTKMGISDPTAAEIDAALNGGTVVSADGSTQTLQGTLALRARGEGWGKIAKTLGFNLGTVVSASKTSHAHPVTGQATHGHEVASTGRPQHADHPSHPVRPQHPDVPQRPDVPDRGGRPGH